MPLLQSALGSLRTLRPSWPAPPGAFGRLGRFAGHLPRLSPRAGWLLYTLACFVSFVVLTFPADVLLQRLIASAPREAGVHARYVEGTCTWLGGCALRDLTLEGPSLGGTAVQLSRLTLRPSLWGLLAGGRPWPLAFQTEGYDGTCEGTLRQVIGGLSVQFALRHLALEQLALPAPWGQGRISGRVTADGDFSGNPADLYSLQGTFLATLTDGALRAGAMNGFPVPAVPTVQVRLRATLAAGRVEISELRFTADGVEASLRGGVTLRTPVARSGLDLQLTAVTTSSLPPAWKTLFSLLPGPQGPAGERRASIAGSVAAPVVR
ncbi:MAG TPA: type II secretion system protein GspN [Candidatus Binatia bacterium]|nr:type II secretion system protein GspN [Candidatus Binatia bacterium]